MEAAIAHDCTTSTICFALRLLFVPPALLFLSALLRLYYLSCLVAAVTVGRRPEVGGKVGQQYLRSLGSAEDCDGSLEVLRRHRVQVNAVVVQ